MMRISEQIKLVLTKFGWSPEILAGKLRVQGVSCSTSSIYEWMREDSDPAPEKLKDLTSVLDQFLSHESLSKE